MALTTVTGKHTINITFDGSTLWDSGTAYPDGLVIESMEFVPAATADILTVRETDASGVAYFNATGANAYDNYTKYFNTEKSSKKFYPYVVGNQATTAGMLIIELK